MKFPDYLDVEIHVVCDTRGNLCSFTFNPMYEGCGYIPITKQEVRIAIDDTSDRTNDLVKILRKQQEKIRAIAETDVQEVEDKIRSLLALPAPEES